jgi:tetratricopeptide (TPR) repeat protein
MLSFALAFALLQDRVAVASREFALSFTSREEKVTFKALWVSRDGGRSWKPAREAGVTESWGEWAEGKVRCAIRVPEDGAYDFYAQLGDEVSNRTAEPQPGQAADARLRLEVKTAPAPVVRPPVAPPSVPPTAPAVARGDVGRARALYDRARVLHAQQRAAEAQLKYEEALSAWPEFSEALNDLGKLHHDAKDPAKALEFFVRARKACPCNPVPYVNAARAELDLGLGDEALKDLRDALALGLDKDERLSVVAGETLWSLARAAVKAEDRGRAREACEMILKIRAAARPTRAKAEQTLEWLRTRP